MSPADLQVLRDGDQRRFNRTVRLVAWALSQLGWIVRVGVNHGVVSALGSRNQMSRPIKWHELAETAPGYDPSED